LAEDEGGAAVGGEELDGGVEDVAALAV